MNGGEGKNNAAKGRRYSIAEKRAVLEFVEKVNSERGRGGISSASKRFGVSPLTISTWIRSAGAPTQRAGSRASADVFRRLAELHDRIVRMESDLAASRKEYARLKSRIKVAGGNFVGRGLILAGSPFLPGVLLIRL